MCDEFICADSGVGLCEDDRILLEMLGNKGNKKNNPSCNSDEKMGSDTRNPNENWPLGYAVTNNNDIKENDRNLEAENKEGD